MPSSVCSKAHAKNHPYEIHPEELDPRETTYRHHAPMILRSLAFLPVMDDKNIPFDDDDKINHPHGYLTADDVGLSAARFEDIF